MAHSTQAAHSHMHDHEGHVAAVEADLEYWRTKRLEPRALQLHRRGVLTLYDLLRSAADLPAAPDTTGKAAHDIEGRIRALEDNLDEYIRGIALVSFDTPGQSSVIEDIRKERGDYDGFFRIAKPPHGGTLEERITRLEHDLREYQRLAQVLLRALLDRACSRRTRSSSSAPCSRGAGPGTAPALSRAPGSIPCSSRPCSRAAARRCVS
jgi:hypothetical protein